MARGALRAGLEDLFVCEAAGRTLVWLCLLLGMLPCGLSGQGEALAGRVLADPAAVAAVDSSPSALPSLTALPREGETQSNFHWFRGQKFEALPSVLVDYRWWFKDGEPLLRRVEMGMRPRTVKDSDAGLYFAMSGGRMGGEWEALSRVRVEAQDERRLSAVVREGVLCCLSEDGMRVERWRLPEGVGLEPLVLPVRCTELLDSTQGLIARGNFADGKLYRLPEGASSFVPLEISWVGEGDQIVIGPEALYRLTDWLPDGTREIRLRAYDLLTGQLLFTQVLPDDSSWWLAGFTTPGRLWGLSRRSADSGCAPCYWELGPGGTLGEVRLGERLGWLSWGLQLSGDGASLMTDSGWVYSTQTAQVVGQAEGFAANSVRWTEGRLLALGGGKVSAYDSSFRLEKEMEAPAGAMKLRAWEGQVYSLCVDAEGQRLVRPLDLSQLQVPVPGARRQLDIMDWGFAPQVDDSYVDRDGRLHFIDATAGRHLLWSLSAGAVESNERLWSLPQESMQDAAANCLYLRYAGERVTRLSLGSVHEETLLPREKQSGWVGVALQQERMVWLRSLPGQPLDAAVGATGEKLLYTLVQSGGKSVVRAWGADRTRELAQVSLPFYGQALHALPEGGLVVRGKVFGALRVAVLDKDLRVLAIQGRKVQRRLANLSIHAWAGMGEEALVPGFVVKGLACKSLLLRAAGPALGAWGVSGALPAVRLELRDAWQLSLGTNAAWPEAAMGFHHVFISKEELVSCFQGLGAFAFEEGSRDAALFTYLAPGLYTAQVQGDSNATGRALVELFDAEENAELARVVNFSARCKVTPDQVAIGGFVVEGDRPRRLLLRAVGPGLAPFGVVSCLSDPKLRLFSGQTLIMENDQWGADASKAAEARAFALASGAFALGEGSRDAVLVVELPPGAYTFWMESADGGSGVGLLECYDLEP